ncbi:MAG: DNA gyrase inhibitor YacG [Pseudobdellovibrio sp.]
MKQVKCPQCGLYCIYSVENPYRPFCSDRCKLIDLGEWASGGYAIPVQNPKYNELEIEELMNQLEQSEKDLSVAAYQTVAGRKQQE